MTLKIHLRDLSEAMVGAWQQEFRGVDAVQVSQGDIFNDAEGALDNDASITIHADAIVSPANSVGFMDGGIDAVYTHVFGPQLQRGLQAHLEADFGGELLVGQATIVPTHNKTIPWCISAPTMRTPRVVEDTVNAYLAFRAALLATLAHNVVYTEAGLAPIETILCPGLGTAIGRMPVERCARQMRAAYDRVLGPGLPFPDRLGHAVADEQWLLG